MDTYAQQIRLRAELMAKNSLDKYSLLKTNFKKNRLCLDLYNSINSAIQPGNYDNIYIITFSYKANLRFRVLQLIFKLWAKENGKKFNLCRQIYDGDGSVAFNIYRLKMR